MDSMILCICLFSTQTTLQVKSIDCLFFKIVYIVYDFLNCRTVSQLLNLHVGKAGCVSVCAEDVPT